jgi:hypothetical protein
MRPVRLPLGRHPRRTSAHDDEVVERRLRLGAQTEVLGQLLVAGVRQVRAVPEQQQGQAPPGRGTQFRVRPARAHWPFVFTLKGLAKRALGWLRAEVGVRHGSCQEIRNMDLLLHPLMRLCCWTLHRKAKKTSAPAVLVASTRFRIPNHCSSHLPPALARH